MTIRRKYAATSRVFGDVDNHIKAVFDALTGVCIADDAQVVSVTARKEQSVEEGIGVAIEDAM